MRDYVRAEKDGENLRLVLHPEMRAEAEELREAVRNGEMSTGDAEAELLEHLICNGFSYVEPGDFGALTDAPMISEDTEEGETGQPTVPPGGTVYAFMDYQVKCLVDEVLANPRGALWIGAKVVSR